VNLSRWRAPRAASTRAGLGPQSLDRSHAPVALRQLVLAAYPDDFQLPTWCAILDRIGSPYDVMFTDRETLSGSLLTHDGIGRYSAVFLTSAALLRPDEDGFFVSTMDALAWSALWDYERAYDVRQVALNAAPGVEPQDDGFRCLAEGPTGATPLYLRMTMAGTAVFDYLNPDALLPVADSYLYRTTIASGANTEPLLTLDGDVVAALTTAPDGREAAALCFTLGAHQPLEEILGYGLLRWATRGVFVGERRHWLNVDIDDWCDLDGLITGDVIRDGPAAGASTRAMARAQGGLRAQFPLASGLTLNLAYNAAPASRQPVPVSAGHGRHAVDGDDEVWPASYFGWINHTYTHPWMETISYEQSIREIADNLSAARMRGLPVNPAVLKTPGYSGLGVLGVLGDGEGRLVDAGLEASNPALLRAARDLGVRFMHGDMSYVGHRPSHHNGGTVHPLQPEITLVPDWTTAIPWWAGTPEEVVAGYDDDLDYDDIIENEADIALRHLMRGSVYTHTVHRANTFEYLPGRSVTVDWLDRVLSRYSELYRVPLITLDWGSLAEYVEARMSHAEAVNSGQDVIWDRSAGVVRFRATTNTSLFITGVTGQRSAGAGSTSAGSTSVGGRVVVQAYGSDHVARVDCAHAYEVVLSTATQP